MTATTPNDLRLWKIFGGCDAFGGIWNVPTWSRHGGALLGNAPLLCSEREIYPKPRVVSSPKPDFFATVSKGVSFPGSLVFRFPVKGVSFPGILSRPCSGLIHSPESYP